MIGVSHAMNLSFLLTLYTYVSYSKVTLDIIYETVFGKPAAQSTP